MLCPLWVVGDRYCSRLGGDHGSKGCVYTLLSFLLNKAQSTTSSNDTQLANTLSSNDKHMVLSLPTYSTWTANLFLFFFAKRAYIDCVTSTTTVEASRCEEGASNYGSQERTDLGPRAPVIFTHEPWVHWVAEHGPDFYRLLIHSRMALTRH